MEKTLYSLSAYRAKNSKRPTSTNYYETKEQAESAAQSLKYYEIKEGTEPVPGMFSFTFGNYRFRNF